MLGLALIAGGAVSLGALRRWYTRWGATEAEVARPMPLDDLVSMPLLSSTRAVTIEAPTRLVWPWVVQMGEPPRAGFYSYTWLERLQGLRVENTDRLLPEFQTLRPGDCLDSRGDMRVLDVEPGRYLALGPSPAHSWLQSVWLIALYPKEESTTRLVARLRARVSLPGMLRALPAWVWPSWFLIEPGVFIMERKMLLGIKARAERLAREKKAQTPNG